MQSAGLRHARDAVQAGATDPERDHLHGTGIYRYEGAIDPSAVIVEREWIRGAHRQDVAGWRKKKYET